MQIRHSLIRGPSMVFVKTKTDRVKTGKYIRNNKDIDEQRFKTD